MIKFFIIGILMFFANPFNSFGSKNVDNTNDFQMVRIINNSIVEVKNTYGLVCIGVGGSEKNGKSSMESVSFNLYRNLTKDEGRILLIEIVELFLHNVNESSEVTSYLHENPFTYRNFEFAIFIYNADGSDVYDPQLGSVCLTSRGTVSFVTYAKGPICKRATDVEESYEKAFKIVKEM